MRPAPLGAKNLSRSGEVLRERGLRQKAEEQAYTRLSNCVECSRGNKQVDVM